MCPDIATLSAYFDSEVSPLKFRKVKSHLKDCLICRETMKLFISQRELIQTDTCIAIAHGSELDKFWQYAGLSRVQRVQGSRRIPISLSLAAVAFVALVVATVMNFIPIDKRMMSPVVLMEQGPYSPTVVTLTLTPSDVDDFFTILEGYQGFDTATIHTLPAELLVSRFGEPQFLRPANLERVP